VKALSPFDKLLKVIVLGFASGGDVLLLKVLLKVIVLARGDQTHVLLLGRTMVAVAVAALTLALTLTFTLILTLILRAQVSWWRFADKACRFVGIFRSATAWLCHPKHANQFGEHGG
jgi:hypothetical protein